MDVQITARHFKARPSLHELITESLQKLSQIYDGILSAEVVLEGEAHPGGKVAEVALRVYHDRLFAKETSDEFEKSVAACINKLEKQLRKYKEKLKNGKQIREQRKGAMSMEGEMTTEEEM